MKSNSFAIIVAIEHYQFANQRGLTNVNFAKHDASEIKSLFINELEIPENQILFWTDEQATKSALMNELPYQIKQLNEYNQFYFYYVGHGLCLNKTNILTAWDSHPFNLNDTSVSIQDILINPLTQSNCRKNMIFIDACSVALEQNSRDLLSDLNINDFESFIRSSQFSALFCSCSPGEKSYSDHILEHGIWTWHLIQALKGNLPSALVRKKYITGDSLRNCLRKSIPEYITKKTNIKGTQTPFSIISANSTFEIRQLPPLLTNSLILPKINLDTDNVALRKQENIPVNKMPGFIKNSHHVPTYESPATHNFVKGLYDNVIEPEINGIYDTAKSILDLRRRDIVKTIDKGAGNIDTATFRYIISVTQSNSNPSEAVILRELKIRAELSSLPTNFDTIFSVKLDEVVIPLEGEISFDIMVDAFENLKDTKGGYLHENDHDGVIKYTTCSGFSIIIRTYEQLLIIQPKDSWRGVLVVLNEAFQGISQLMGNSVIKLLK